MFTLLIGGSASGKSALAERLVAQSGAKHPLYLATMQLCDEESRMRAARHRARRAGAGYTTLECPLDLLHAELPACDAALLECLGNLAANERFDRRGAGNAAASAILRGIERLRAHTPELVVVGNDLFSGGQRYDPDTSAYLELLAAVQRELAAQADRVAEVVCGLPIWHKGGFSC